MLQQHDEALASFEVIVQACVCYYYQLSATSYQLPATSYQLLATSY